MRGVGVILILLLPLAAPAATAVLSEPACYAPASAAGSARVAAGPGELVEVRFRLDRPSVAVFKLGLGYHDDPAGPRERSAALLAVESNDDLLVIDGFVQEGHRVAFADEADVVSVPTPSTGCRATLIERSVPLSRGEHLLVGAFASEGAVEGAVYLPPRTEIASVERHAASALSDESLACERRLRVGAAGALVEALERCAGDQSTSGRTYFLLDTGAPADDDHVVLWDTPIAPDPRRVSRELGTGPAGEYALEVPSYTTRPGGTGTGLGIYGVVGSR